MHTGQYTLYAAAGAALSTSVLLCEQLRTHVLEARVCTHAASICIPCQLFAQQRQQNNVTLRCLQHAMPNTSEWVGQSTRRRGGQRVRVEGKGCRHAMNSLPLQHSRQTMTVCTETKRTALPAPSHNATQHRPTLVAAGFATSHACLCLQVY
jgi:hypothetical protein